MIKEKLESYSFPKKKISTDITDTIIQRSDQFKSDLPDDYLIYCKNFQSHEFEINNQCIILWNIEDLIEINSDYNVKEYCPNILLIGSNRGGEGIAIDFQNSPDTKIVLIPLMDISRANIVEIGDSFTNLFERLENGRDWFD